MSLFLAFFYLFAGELSAGEIGKLKSGAGINGSMLGYAKDGDGFFLKVKDKKFFYDVRLWGVDAPESEQKFGNTAKKFLEELIKGKSLKVVYKSTLWQRIVCQVFIVSGKKETDIAPILLRSGMVWKEPRYAKSMKEYDRIHEKAKKEGIGLFSDNNAVPPWEWRKKLK